MPAYLEAIAGPAKGCKIPLQTGKTVSVGRTERSMVIVKEDDTMSGQHFTVGLKNGNVLLCNLSKTNGTEVNGEKVSAVFLKPGETFKAGMTTFAVMAPAEKSPHEAKLRIGSWGFLNPPEGWELAEGSRFKHPAKEPFQVNISATEELLPNGHTLKTYVEMQVKLGQKHIQGSVFKDPVPAKLLGADEAMALSMTAPIAGKGTAVQHQIYALHAGVVGVLTATALDSQADLLKEAFGPLLKGLSFFHT